MHKTINGSRFAELLLTMQTFNSGDSGVCRISHVFGWQRPISDAKIACIKFMLLLFLFLFDPGVRAVCCSFPMSADPQQ